MGIVKYSPKTKKKLARAKKRRGLLGLLCGLFRMLWHGLDEFLQLLGLKGSKFGSSMGGMGGGGGTRSGGSKGGKGSGGGGWGGPRDTDQYADPDEDLEDLSELEDAEDAENAELEDGEDLPELEGSTPDDVDITVTVVDDGPAPLAIEAGGDVGGGAAA
jgi:hypothetical protein